MKDGGSTPHGPFFGVAPRAGNALGVLVTGATGFVGTALRDALRAGNVAHRAAARRPALNGLIDDTITVGEIRGTTDWSAALSGMSAVVHLAARVHVMKETASDALAEFRRVNTEGTEHLARAAAKAGVRRFVYVSSIKVNGEVTHGRPFSPADAGSPVDPYGVSKWEAEVALARVASETGLEVVVVRPPLVYGANVRGNFLRLLKLARLGLPLPFGAARNLRSLVFVRNLADALVRCIEHPKAVGQTYLVSDGEDLSTAELCRRLSRALGKTPRLLPVPTGVLKSVAAVAHRDAEFQRLFGSLQVDSSSLRAQLEWQPPFTVDQGIAETAAWFRGR
jgi:nucleoside-diphosphate-sugar epimerase